ncbi:MAG: sulfite exporter TauE/SafE family protein [Pseudomonadota bacterium]
MMDPVTIAVFLLAISLLGLSKGGLAGIGLLSMPMMFLVMPPVAAAGLILPILMMQDIFSVYLYRGQWDVENLKLLVPAATVGIALGFLLFAFLPTSVMLLVLGVITLAFAARGLLKPPAPAKTPNKAVGWFLGIASGLTSTVLHQGGPTFQMYMMPQRLPRDTFVATTVCFFWLVNMIKLPGFIVLGQLTREGLVAAFIAMPFALFMTWCGKQLVSRIEVERFYVIIYWILAAVGVKLIVDGVM